MAAEASLQEFLEAPNPGLAEHVLGRLVFEVADPVIRRTVNYRLATLATFQDREDVCGDVTLDLVARLQGCRTGDAEPIGNLPGYAAVTAHHGCDRFLRQRYPQRFRFRNRLRYFLENTKGLITWETPQGELACGSVDDRGKIPARPPEGWQRNAAVRAGASEGDVVKALLEAQSPVIFDDLVRAAADLMNVSDTAGTWETAERKATAPTDDATERLDRKRFLAKLWTEITELPVAQRAAILLNLRDDEGESAVVWLPASGVATIRQIAQALEIEPSEFAVMWRGLPMSDLEIASRLGLNRQQVINLRKAGRQRLGRRLGEEWKL